MSILEKIEVKVRADTCGNPVARAHGKSAACSHSAERAVANLAVKIWGPGEYSRALISDGANGAQLWWIGRPAPGGEAANDRSEVPHGRKPVTLQFKGGKGPRQRVWDAIRAHHMAYWRAATAAWSYLDVVPADIPADTARSYISALGAAGIIEAVGTRRRDDSVLRNQPVKVWRLVQDVGLEAPRLKRDGTPVTQGLAQEQMWRALRMLKIDINARELAAYASTPEIPAAESAARDYLFNLHKAGYLQRTAAMSGKGKTRKPERYRLTQNSGPRAPMVCRSDVVYDPNTDTTHTIERVTEETAIYG